MDALLVSKVKTYLHETLLIEFAAEVDLQVRTGSPQCKKGFSSVLFFGMFLAQKVCCEIAPSNLAPESRDRYKAIVQILGAQLGNGRMGCNADCVRRCPLNLAHTRIEVIQQP